MQSVQDVQNPAAKVDIVSLQASIKHPLVFVFDPNPTWFVSCVDGARRCLSCVHSRFQAKMESTAAAPPHGIHCYGFERLPETIAVKERTRCKSHFPSYNRGSTHPQGRMRTLGAIKRERARVRVSLSLPFVAVCLLPVCWKCINEERSRCRVSSSCLFAAEL